MRRTRTKGICMIIMIAAVMTLMMASSAYGLGMTPARTVIDFEEGAKKDITFNVINNENKDMTLMIYAEGEFSDQVKINKKMIHISRNESMKKVSFSLDMAGEMKKKPGMNEIRVKVLELPEGFDRGSEDAASVSATVEVVHQLRIMVPYPGTYAEITDVYITPQENPGNVMFTIPIFNRGKTKIDGIHGIVKVYDPYGELAGAVNTSSIDLNAGGEGKIEAIMRGLDKRGKYRVEIIVFYSDQAVSIEKEFFLGAELVEIAGVTVDKFTLGDIAKFNILVDSKWTQPIDDVYADVEIRDNSNKQLTRFKTASISLKPEEMGKLEAYWDTEDADPGEYSMHIILYYTRLMTEKWLTMDVGFNSIQIRGATGAVVAGNSDDSMPGSILPALFVILVIINIILVVTLFLRKRKSRL